EAGFQLLAFHGVAAVLDDQRLADEATDIGQRFGQDLGELGGSFTAEGHAGLRKSERQLEIRRDSIKLGAEDVLYALELGFAFRLEAQHQYRCGVGSAHQTPAFRIIDAQAVKGGDAGLAPLGFAAQGFDDGELALFGDLDIDLRSREIIGEGREHLLGAALVLAEDFQQTYGAVDAVIEAVPALFEKDVAAHFARQQ